MKKALLGSTTQRAVKIHFLKVFVESPLLIIVLSFILTHKWLNVREPCSVAGSWECCLWYRLDAGRASVSKCKLILFSQRITESYLCSQMRDLYNCISPVFLTWAYWFSFFIQTHCMLWSFFGDALRCLQVTAAGDQMARLWDVKSGDLLGSFKGHLCSLKSVAFAPEEKGIFFYWAKTSLFEGILHRVVILMLCKNKSEKSEQLSC